MASKKRRNMRQAVRKAGYHSRFEQEIAEMLEQMGVPFGYEVRKYPWKEEIPNAYCGECDNKQCYADRSYTPDFFIFPDTDREFVIEAKGIFTVKDRKIALAMQEQHPGTDMRYIFYFNNKLTKNSKTRYLDWCEKKGLDAADKKCMTSTLDRWTRL